MPNEGVDLPPVMASVLDAARSEAKRRGHGEVTPAHVAYVLMAREEAPKPLTKPELAEAVEHQLGQLRRTFDQPKAAPETLQLLNEAASRAQPLDSLADALRAKLLGPSPAVGTLAAAEAMAVKAAGQEAAPAPVPRILSKRTSEYAEIVETTPPLLGRVDVALRLAAMLGARNPQTPLVIAEQGAGRSTLAQCLAAALAELPESAALRGFPVVRVRPERLIGDGDAAPMMATLLKEVAGQAILFIDDIDVLAFLSVGGPGLGLLRVLRSCLHDPDQRVVFTLEQSYMDSLRAIEGELFDELEVVRIEPIEGSVLLDIARARAQELAAYHEVEIELEVVAAAVAPPKQSDNRVHPGLAVRRLDRAAAAATMREDRNTQASDLGVAAEGQQYIAFDASAAAERLSRVVMGQAAAIEGICRRLSVTRAALDLRPERPDGVFLLAGPTGTGKTFLAENLAQEIYGSPQALIRVDMSELAEWESITKLIGPPPGYVGSKDPDSWLTTKIRKRPQAVLLLDEVEKANPLIWNTFLQVFDAGRLTDSAGRTADFRDVVVVMTSNIGSDVFTDRPVLGFSDETSNSAADEANVRAELKRWMRPELLNRIDAILVFRPLQPEVVVDVARLRLADAIKRLEARGWEVDCDPSVMDLLIEKGYSREYGARPMLRAIEELILAPMAPLPKGTYVLRRAGDAVVPEAT